MVRAARSACYRGRVTSLGTLLDVRIGNQPGACMRVKHTGAELLDREAGQIWTGTISHWSRVAICASSGVRARYWLLEPAEEGAPVDEIAFSGFYVRGRFRRVEVINNARRASETFSAFARV